LLILAHSRFGDSLIRLGSRRLGRHEILLEARDVWLEAYVIGLSREQHARRTKDSRSGKDSNVTSFPLNLATLV